MTQRQKDEMNKALMELRVLRNADRFGDWQQWRIEMAFERLERFIREQCGDRVTAQ